MEGCQAINLFRKLSDIKVGYHMPYRAEPQLMEYWGIQNSGVKEETQQILQSLKTVFTNDKTPYTIIITTCTFGFDVKIQFIHHLFIQST